MRKAKSNTKVKDKAKDQTKESLVENLNAVTVQDEDIVSAEIQSIDDTNNSDVQNSNTQTEVQTEADEEYKKQISEAHSKLFDQWDEKEFIPKDFKIPVYVDSLESAVGYTSLIRQLHDSFIQTIAFYRSPAGGSLSVEEARKEAFRPCKDFEEAKRIFSDIMSFPSHLLHFNQLDRLHSFAPRVAEQVWENIKLQARSEFESGHAAANTMHPAPYMRDVWSIARYLGIRESYIAEWKPKGGIELSLIDMIAQTFFQWQYWLEQTILRSQTEPRREHHEYELWKHSNERTKNAKSWQEGHWFPPYVHEQAAVEHAVQMADRFNRIYMRTLRQLRDLRRYSPVTINNPNQVNIAADGGQQVNVSNPDDEKAKKITS